MKARRIDRKLEGNRFAYDREVLGVVSPVAIQARASCGKMGEVVYMQMSMDVVQELNAFLSFVIWQERLRRAFKDVEKKG